MKIRKELQFTQLSVLLTPHKLTLSDPKLKTWSDSACAKQIKTSTLNNPGQAKNLSHKKLTDHETALLAKGLLFNSSSTGFT